MEHKTAYKLNRLNEQFYLSQSASFDRSRQSFWPGWERIASLSGHIEHATPLRLLDIACGNMRFEKFLIERQRDTNLQALCVDSCPDLAVPLEGCEYRQEDVVECLLRRDTPALRWGCDFDLTVSFGFFHHVPSASLRLALLDELVKTVKPGGLVAISLWRFASDQNMLDKARRTTAEAVKVLALENELDKGDYLLGWNGVAGVYRYCHSFDDKDVEEMALSITPTASIEDRFRADGRTGALNEYLVFRKR